MKLVRVRTEPDAKTAKVREFLGTTTTQFVTVDQVIDHMRRRGVPEAELRKARARKWARQEAARLSQQIAENPQIFAANLQPGDVSIGDVRDMPPAQ